MDMSITMARQSMEIDRLAVERDAAIWELDKTARKMKQVEAENSRLTHAVTELATEIGRLKAQRDRLRAAAEAVLDYVDGFSTLPDSGSIRGLRAALAPAPDKEA